MKRFLLSLIIALSAAGSACAQLRFGIDLGVDVSHLSFSKDVVDSKNRMGFFLGPKMHAKVKKLGLGADVALRYAQKTAAIEVMDGQSTAVREREGMSYVEVPLNVRWDITPFKAFGIYIATGPQWDWYIGKSVWESTDEFKATFDHSALSWNIGVGITLINRIHLTLSHNIPVTGEGTILSTAYDSVKAHVEETEIKNYSWRLALDFYF